MSENEKFLYWLDIAEYDIVTAGAMCNSGRWLYVAYMCQQAIEKLCKGLYILFVDDNIPRSHNIGAIVSRFSDKMPNEIGEEMLNLFDRLTAYYLNGRYPEYKEKLSSSIDEQTAKRFLQDTKEAFEWLLAQKT